ADHLEQHLGVEIVALLADWIEQLRQGLRRDVGELLAGGELAEADLVADLDPDVLQDLPQGVPGHEPWILQTARVAAPTEIRGDAPAHLRTQPRRARRVV